MATVKWSDHALNQVREQARYISERSGSHEIAWKWANGVFDAADGLADFPDMGHRLPEFPDAPYLEIVVRKSYRLIYRQAGEVCLVVTVRRCSMLMDDSAIDDLDAVE